MPLQVSQNYRTGKVSLDEVGMPALRRGGVIIQNEFSVISPGTEGIKLKEARLSLLQKAHARPDQVRQVMDVARQQGLRAAYQKVINRLEQLTPLGYSVAGRVVAVGADVFDIAVGDRVAAGGAGYANHAEYNFVPRNLIVPILETVSSEHAAFTTIGSIAIHAYRQSNIMLGEKALVIGLGLVGQLLTQILVAAGVSVVGVDLVEERCKLAAKSGAIVASSPNEAAWKQALAVSGADVVFIAAGSVENSLLELAANHVRDRGVIVVVGKTILELDYNVFFKKEIEVRFSRSYGPGRFDPNYEERGNDYPLPYVRWTEQRNMASFIDLLARDRLSLAPLMDVMRPFEAAVEVLDQLYERQINSIGVVFNYSATEQTKPHATIGIAVNVTASGKKRVGIIGAGTYAASMLLPELRSNPKIELVHVVTTSGLSANSIARRFQIPIHGTDVNAIFADSTITGVVIATRHSSHASLVAQALTAGKAVFVEKPLAIDEDGLALVRQAMRPNSRLMVGYNRRHAPVIRRLKNLCKDTGPLQIVYRVQAGSLPPDAWQCQREEGGRFLGEAGHFFDVFQFLTGARPLTVNASRLHPPVSTLEHNSSLSVTVAYDDGSNATLLYGTLGSARLPKEYLEVHGGGQSFIMNNFNTLEIYGVGIKPKVERGFGSDKGQAAQMKFYAELLANDNQSNVYFVDIERVTELTIAAHRAAMGEGSIQLT
jgi:predicted dehydrogenase/threonine dehydrogenase-like Zn-dependent dehydrogenase